MRFILFTKTEWNEPPRLRHQIANLLIDHGHEVVFFQKSRITSRKESTQQSDSCTLLRHPHLLHHQLKFVAPARWLDAVFLKSQIRSLVAVNDRDVIVNFNYDFFFLSELFPDTPIVHVVNDDFPAAAIPPNRRSATRLQALTAKDAGHTLCVSYSITSKIMEATTNCSLFLPWARHEYIRPPYCPNRDETLYWGYINERLDFGIVNGLLESGIKINFFGHITPSDLVSEILAHPNATYHGVSGLEDVPEILSRCSCTLLPYDASDEATRAVTISNRGFELLSFGLPLVYIDLPHLITAPERVIYRCSTVQEFALACQDTRENFELLQDDIANFLKDHYSDKRYQQFMDAVDLAQALH